MPEMKMVGMKTAARISASETTGPATSSMALMAASLGFKPSSIWRSVASTTTIASSTTSPMASTKPNSERVFKENPKIGKKANVPIRATGTASKGMSVARQPCRKIKTTMATRTSAMTSVRRMSCMPSETASVVSSGMA